MCVAALAILTLASVSAHPFDLNRTFYELSDPIYPVGVSADG